MMRSKFRPVSIVDKMFHMTAGNIFLHQLNGKKTHGRNGLLENRNAVRPCSKRRILKLRTDLPGFLVEEFTSTSMENTVHTCVQSKNLNRLNVNNSYRRGIAYH